MTTTYAKTEMFDAGMRSDRRVYVEWNDLTRTGRYSDTAKQAVRGGDQGYPHWEVKVLDDGSVLAREVHVGGSGQRVAIPKELVDLLVAYLAQPQETP